MTQLKDLKKRQIQNLILENPGLYLTKIAEILDLSVTVVELYLRELENESIINTTEESGYKRYSINKKDKVLGQTLQGTRRDVYDLVVDNPGLSLTSVAEKLKMGISLARYHLNYLEKKGLVSSVKEEGYKRYYSKSSEMGVSEKKLLALFRQEIPLKIVFLLLQKNHMQHKEILKHFDFAPSTLTYHLNKLLRDEVISVQKYGEEKGYLIADKKIVIEFLRKYKIYKMMNNFNDIWGSINYDY